MKNDFVKRPRSSFSGLMVAVVFLVVVLGMMGCDETDCNKCPTCKGCSPAPILDTTNFCIHKYRFKKNLPERKFPLGNWVSNDAGDQIEFSFDNWCDTTITQGDPCICQMTNKTISVHGVNLPWGETVQIRMQWPFKDTVKVETQNVKLDSILFRENRNYWRIYEGSKLWIDFDEGVDTSGIFIGMGGLCVVVNVDGSDGGIKRTPK